VTRLNPLLWIWLGAALLFVAVVAPAAFAVLPTRSLAGLLVGRVLPTVFWSGALVGLVMAVAETGWRRVAALVVVATALGAQLGVAPRIQRLRAALGPDIEAIDATDPRRVEFGRLHALSVALLGGAMLAAAAVALASVRSSRTSAERSRTESRVAPHVPSGV
jgi:hypothetical protein